MLLHFPNSTLCLFVSLYHLNLHPNHIAAHNSTASRKWNSVGPTTSVAVTLLLLLLAEGAKIVGRTGATETLIEAWGDRYARLNRGHLHQKEWKEVAESVNSRENGVKPKKTEIQCKNRIDTLKKKYKIEKAKPPPSKWPFYYRLDSLIGNDAVSSSSKKPTNVTPRVKSKPTTSFIRRKISTENDSLSSDGDGGGDDDDDKMVVKKVHRMEDVDLSDGAACRELSRAILKFGEIYERIENEKQKKMMELEKERLEFIKDVECERMNMFMGAQLEIQKSKRKNRAACSGKKSQG